MKDRNRLASRPRRRPKRWRWLFYPLVSLGGYDLTPLRSLGLIVFVFVPLGALAYFILPSGGCEVVEARPVEAHFAAEGVKARLGGKLYLGGLGKIVVLKEHADGEWLFVRLKFSQRFLQRKGAVKAYWISLINRDIELQADGTTLPPLLLTRDYADHTEGVFVETDPGGTNRLESPPWSFEGKSGMIVKFQYQGTLLSITWNPGSMAWFVDNEIREGEMLMDSMTLQVACLFRRPKGPGPYKLRVFDHEVSVQPR